MKKTTKRKKVARSRKGQIFLNAAKTITKEFFLEILKTIFPWIREVELMLNFKTYIRQLVRKLPIRYLVKYLTLAFL